MFRRCYHRLCFKSVAWRPDMWVYLPYLVREFLDKIMVRHMVSAIFLLVAFMLIWAWLTSPNSPCRALMLLFLLAFMLLWLQLATHSLPCRAQSWTRPSSSYGNEFQTECFWYQWKTLWKWKRMVFFACTYLEDLSIHWSFKFWNLCHFDHILPISSWFVLTYASKYIFQHCCYNQSW